ncbi:MAG: cysteine--tRNA ligase, partial [Pseudomonadota bacterium]
AGDADALLASGRLMGFFGMSSEQWFHQPHLGDLTVDEIEGLIAARQAARKNKDFAKSDQIRDDLAAKGVILEDSPEGVTWRRE